MTRKPGAGAGSGRAKKDGDLEMISSAASGSGSGSGLGSGPTTGTASSRGGWTQVGFPTAEQQASNNDTQDPSEDAQEQKQPEYEDRRLRFDELGEVQGLLDLETRRPGFMREIVHMHSLRAEHGDEFYDDVWRRARELRAG